jgi:hypothetical protein
VERSLHELLDFDEPNSGFSRDMDLDRTAALVRFVEQRQDGDPELSATAAGLKAALESLLAMERNLERTYQGEDAGRRAKVTPFYIRTLFDLGREAKAFEVIRAARRMGLSEPIDFAMIGGALMKNGHFADAAGWYTRGLVQHAGSLAGIRLDDMLKDDNTGALARGRRTARHALGVAPDHLDELYDRYEAIVIPDESQDEPGE